ncbi:MAG: hypothetical protein K5873_09575 [Treponema sp.]|nr:hypothetical protein [Treponema sp.]
MKKIVSAALVASLVAGVAFADVTIKTNYRLGTNLLTINPGEGGAADVMGINDLTKTAWGDTTQIDASGENAGVTLKLKTSESSLDMDYAYAWMGWGNFKLYAGRRDYRGFIKRVNPLDGNWWNNYCEYGKPGLHKDVKAVAIDSVQVTATQDGTNTVCFQPSYDINETTNITAAFFKNATSDKLFNNFNAALQFNMKHDMFNLNVTGKLFRSYTAATAATATAAAVDEKYTNAWSLGVVANIIAVENLDTLVGLTLGSADTDADDKVYTGIDLRLAYTMDALKLYTLNNITLHDGDMISWHTLGGAYKVSDVISAVGLQMIINSTADAPWSKASDAGSKKEYLAVRPYVDLTAQKNAVLSIGAELKFVNFMANSDADEKVDFQFTVPVVFRVKL